MLLFSYCHRFDYQNFRKHKAKYEEGLPKTGRITVRDAGHEMYCVDVCRQMYAFLIQRNRRYVHSRLREVWKNIRIDPHRTIFKTRHVQYAKWKEHFESFLLTLDLQVLHYCKATDNLQLALQKTKEWATLEHLY